MLTLGVIPKHFPLRLVIKIVTVIAVGAAITTVLLYITSQIWLGTSYTEGLKTLSDAKQLLFRNSIIIYLFTSLFIIGGIILLTLIYSHRVAGPLYRLGVSAKKVAEGDLTVNVNLRKDDAIHPLADSMNRLIENYNRRAKEFLDDISSLKEATTAMEDATEKGPREDLQKAIDEVSEKAERLLKNISAIRL